MPTKNLTEVLEEEDKQTIINMMEQEAFADKYLGSHASAPATDNQGGVLVEGVVYWNSTTKKNYTWNATAPAWELWNGGVTLDTAQTITAAKDFAIIPKANGTELATLDTAQTITAEKNFTVSPTVPDASTATQAVNKGQLDLKAPIVSPTFIGAVLATNSTGIGYTTGSGGTVTQATSKTTAVTLNKPCGTITMNNASIPANSSVLFQLNNTLAQTGDMLTLHVQYDNAASPYLATCGIVSIGNGFYINVRNLTSVAIAEPIRISFAIIRGALA